MKNKVFVNYIYMTAYQLLLVVLPIITTPYVSRTLGVDGVGAASYVGTVVSYFVLFAQGGLSIYGRRQIAQCQEDQEKRSGLFWQLLFIKFFSFIAVTTVFWILFYAWNIQPELLLISGITLFATLFDISWFFQGLEDFRLVTIRNFIVRIAGVICIFVLVKGPEDVGIYLGISSISELISQLSLWLCVGKYIKKVKFHLTSILPHVKNSWIMFIPTIFNSLYTKVDKVMLGMLTTDAQVGIYSQGEKIIDLLFKLIGSMGLVYMPALARMLGEKNGLERVSQVLSKNALFVWEIGIPLSFGIAAISRTFSVVFFGFGYEDVSKILVILAPIIVFLGFSDLFGGQYMIASGMQKEFNMTILAGAVIDIVLNAFMIGSMGAVGASISTVFAELSIAIYQYMIIRKKVDIKVMPRFYLILAGVIMFCVVKAMDILMQANIFSLVLQIIAGGVIYITIIIINKDEMFFDVIHGIKTKIRKEK